MPYYCYLVRCANDALYAGWTTDPIRREKEHNAGRGARYTRMNGPVRLVYVEEVENHSEALKREAKIKRMSSQSKRKLIDKETNLLAEFLMSSQKNDLETPENPSEECPTTECGVS